MSTSGTYIPERAKGIPFTDDEVSEIENTHDTHFNSTAKILTILKTQLPGGDRGITAGGDSGAGGQSRTNVIEYITISTPSNATDFGDLTNNRAWPAATSNGVNDRGIISGGNVSSTVYNIIDYMTISTPGDALDFGDLTSVLMGAGASSNGSNDRGIIGGGSPSTSINYQNIINYVTISTPGDALDFGDLSVSRYQVGGTSNGVNDRALFSGGMAAGATYVNTIDYITISIVGNASDFGDLTQGRTFVGSISNDVNDRGISAGGQLTTSTLYNIIEYVTISTIGNSSDFGDLSITKSSFDGTSNGVKERGVFCGGILNITTRTNIIDYITISTTGNSIDFGDLTFATNTNGVSSDGAI